MCRADSPDGNAFPTLLISRSLVCAETFLLQRSLFGNSKKPSSTPPRTPPISSPDKDKDKEKRTSYFGKEKDKDRDKLKRSSKSFPSRSGNRRGSDEHPLNLPPDELRRLSALSARKMSSTNSPRHSREGGVPVPPDAMETIPAPETPGSFPTTNGTNGISESAEEGEHPAPAPPPHKSQPTSPPPPETRPEDAEKFKAEGNKYYKVGKYAAAIDEYGKGTG